MLDRLRFTLLPPSGLLAFVIWGLIFAIAYTQNPLYTSNQNQYFLHGLAEAGFGHLAEDWLANTLDPAPLFSTMVELIYVFFKAEWLFHVIYALLMGVYFSSLWGITVQLYERLSEPAPALALIAALITVHSAGWRFLASRLLGDNWTFVLEDGVADQRLLGLVLQPSSFGVFLLLSVYLFLLGKPVLAALLAVAAAVFHPTYLLSAATLTGIYVLVSLAQGKDRKKGLAAGALALVLVLPIIVYTYRLFTGAPAEISAQAQQILVEYRIPHHAIVEWWLDETAVLKIGIVAGATWLAWRKSMRLFWVLAVSALTATTLTLVQIAIGSNALALLFPWRLSTYLVPLSTATLLASLVNWLTHADFMASKLWRSVLIYTSGGLILLSLVVGGVRFWLDLERRAADPERVIEGYTAAQRKPGEVYLIPIKMQDFRLETGAAVMVDFKSIPYQPEEVLEWYRRVYLADQYFKSGDCSLLSEIRLSVPVTHVVEDLSESNLDCTQLEMLYSDSSYRLWRLNQPAP